MQTFAQKAIAFHQNLKLELPETGIEVLNPFLQEKVMEHVSEFFMKYFNDDRPRTFLFGINPGRFGAGITGISFTDPVNLQEKCGIANNFEKRHELSSQFIYEVIDAYGGVKPFYDQFFMTAISPLGFVKEGKNINYYDEKPLKEMCTPFIEKQMISQLKIGANRKLAICIGGGKNLKYFQKLNERLGLFDDVLPLDHPRFVMQYRRKSKDQYVKKYLDTLNFCESLNNG
jgi:hypothetical protein